MPSATIAGPSLRLRISIRFNERISINNRHVSDEDIVASYEAVKSVHHGSREPTFFEFATAMALYEFGRQKVDWAVIETGMGGRLDEPGFLDKAASASKKKKGKTAAPL